MKTGDWVELRDAPNTRGVIKHVHQDERVTMQLSGDYDLITMALGELRERWEPMQLQGEPPPFWVHRRMLFVKQLPLPRDEDLYAEIIEARPGWVAYYAKYAIRSRAPLFLMAPWWEFRKQYDPVKPPSAWDHLLNGDDG